MAYMDGGADPGLALDRLGVSREEALRKVARLLNIGSLSQSLFQAEVAVELFNDAPELKTLPFNHPGFGDALQVAKLGDVSTITQASLTAQSVGASFILFLNQIWGTDSQTSLGILGQIYSEEHGELGIDELLTIFELALGGITIVASIINPIAGAGFVALGALVAGGHLYYQLQEGIITSEEFTNQLILEGFFLALAGIGLGAGVLQNLHNGINFGATLDETTKGARLLRALEILTAEPVDTSLEVIPDYDSALLDLTNLFLESGATQEEIDAVLEIIQDPNTSLDFDPSGFAIPTSGLQTHETPLDIEDTGPQYVDPDNPPDGRFQYWLDARRSEYLRIATTNPSADGFADYLTTVVIPEEFRDALWETGEELDPRWWSF